MTTGHDFVSVLLTQQGAAYDFGEENDPGDPDSPKHRGTDCSEFGQWACDRLAVMPPYPDGTWNQVAHIRAKGLLVPVDQALVTVGAALFHFSGDPFQGHRPTEAHTAYSLGDGARTIEARGRAYGVGIFGDAAGRGWTHAGLIPGIFYARAAGTPTAPTSGAVAPAFPGRHMRLTGRPYMTGADVRSVQQRLRDRGWKIDVDGVFGPRTDTVVEAFQREKHLSVDGVVGPSTWRAIFTAPVT